MEFEEDTVLVFAHVFSNWNASETYIGWLIIKLILTWKGQTIHCYNISGILISTESAVQKSRYDHQ